MKPCLETPNLSVITNRDYQVNKNSLLLLKLTWSKQLQRGERETD